MDDLGHDSTVHLNFLCKKKVWLIGRFIQDPSDHCSCFLPCLPPILNQCHGNPKSHFSEYKVTVTDKNDDQNQRCRKSDSTFKKGRSHSVQQSPNNNLAGPRYCLGQLMLAYCRYMWPIITRNCSSWMPNICLRSFINSLYTNQTESTDKLGFFPNCKMSCSVHVLAAIL